MKGLKIIREAQNMSQEQLASTLQVDRSTVAKWETGDSYPRGKMLKRLADLFCCSIDELFGRASDSTSATSDSKI